MTADKWGIDELYQHLLEEFKRSKIALAFFVEHRHEVKKHSADTLELLKILDNEQMHEVLVAAL
jgi:hypothetical protein